MKSLNEILDVLGQKLVSIGEVTVTPVLLITMALIIILSFAASWLIQRLLRRKVFARVRLKQGARSHANAAPATIRLPIPIRV